MRVMIDPGHGGTDRGACYNGVEEASINWIVASELYLILKALGWQNAFLSREATETVSLNQRGKRAHGAQLSVHLHCDARLGSNASGIRTYCWPGNERTKALGQAVTLASPIELRGQRPAEPREVASDVRWLSRARNVLRKMPCDALLVEMGFLTNEDDCRVLVDPRVHYVLALGIAAALSQYQRLL